MMYVCTECGWSFAQCTCVAAPPPPQPAPQKPRLMIIDLSKITYEMADGWGFEGRIDGGIETPQDQLIEWIENNLAVINITDAELLEITVSALRSRP